MIQIFTSVVNRPDFVSIQDDLFKKFLTDEYQFHVVDDSIDENISSEFKEICDQRNIHYYKTPKNLEHNNPSTKVGNVIQWTFDEIIKKEYSSDIIFWTDSDMFLIDEFSIIDHMKDCAISGLPQIRGNVKYMWNGIMFFDMQKICEIDPNLNFSDGQVEGELTDTNGHLHYYFKRNNITFKETDVDYPETYDDINLEEVCGGINFELHLNSKFLHYRAATNWHSNWRGSEDPLISKTKIFNLIIESILDNNGQK